MRTNDEDMTLKWTRLLWFFLDVQKCFFFFFWYNNTTQILLSNTVQVPVQVPVPRARFMGLACKSCHSKSANLSHTPPDTHGGFQSVMEDGGRFPADPKACPQTSTERLPLVLLDSTSKVAHVRCVCNRSQGTENTAHVFEKALTSRRLTSAKKSGTG